MSRILNYTPHAVKVINNVDGSTRTYETQGVARVLFTSKVYGAIDSSPIIVRECGDIIGLPAPEEDTFYIVSNILASAVPDRTDLLVPDNFIRDDTGNIVGCTSLCLINR